MEHPIGGMKVFHYLTHRIRNHLDPLIEASSRSLEPKNSLKHIEMIEFNSRNNSNDIFPQTRQFAVIGKFVAPVIRGGALGKYF